MNSQVFRLIGLGRLLVIKLHGLSNDWILFRWLPFCADKTAVSYANVAVIPVNLEYKVGKELELIYLGILQGMVKILP